MFYSYIEIDYILTVGSKSEDFTHIIYDLECDPDELENICEEDVKRSTEETAFSKGSTIYDWLEDESLFTDFRKGYTIELNGISAEE